MGLLASDNSNIPLRYRCPLEVRKVFKYGMRGAIKASLAWIVIGGVYFWSKVQTQTNSTFSQLFFENWPALLGLAVLLFIGAFAHPVLYYLSYFYDVDDKNVIIRKGVIAKREIILPFSRITDVNVQQDWLDVLLGLYDIHISTPTADSGKFAHIDGVNKKSAHTIRKILMDRINSLSYEVTHARSSQVPLHQLKAELANGADNQLPH